MVAYDIGLSNWRLRLAQAYGTVKQHDGERECLYFHTARREIWAWNR